jgi:3-oxoacyl-[acyl-carrier protein] reductase/pteridine reductase
MHAHYCASKAGVIHLTKAMAKALAPWITVNTVAPGTILEPEFSENIDALVEATPARRRGTVEEVAEAVVYFLRASNFVTGQLLAVDGGLGLR